MFSRRSNTLLRTTLVTFLTILYKVSAKIRSEEEKLRGFSGSVAMSPAFASNRPPCPSRRGAMEDTDSPPSQTLTLTVAGVTDGQVPVPPPSASHSGPSARAPRQPHVEMKWDCGSSSVCPPCQSRALSAQRSGQPIQSERGEKHNISDAVTP